MNATTLRSAIEQQRWDVAAHMLVYGLIKAQAGRSNPDVSNSQEFDSGKKGRPASQAERN